MKLRIQLRNTKLRGFCVSLGIFPVLFASKQLHCQKEKKVAENSRHFQRVLGRSSHRRLEGLELQLEDYDVTPVKSESNTDRSPHHNF